MLKILINAYACSPGMGTEPGIAWNWVSNLANLLNELEKDRSLLRLLSENCKERQMELSWEEKAKVMVEWYKKGKML